MMIGRTEWTLTSHAAVIDLHCHLLPGIDDGAPDMQASVEMARAAIAGGVDEIVATPHVSGKYRNDPTQLVERVAEVQTALNAAGIELKVHKGAELSFAMYHDLSEEALRACTLGEGGFLLLEPSLSGPIPFLERLVHDLQLRHYQIVLAHPERIAAFQRDIGLLGRLVEGGCLTSVTAGSLSGQFGGSVKRFTLELFSRGIVHNLASDAHDAHHRSPALGPTLADGIEELPDLEGWLDYLTVDVPSAILAGELPSRAAPVLKPTKRGFLDRLRNR